MKTTWTFAMIAAGLSPAMAAAGVIYVDINAPGPADGSSWCNAYRHLQDALAAAGPGAVIHIAGGVYRPDQGAGQTPGNPAATFMMRPHLQLLGGWAGCGPNEGERNPLTYETVLEGAEYIYRIVTLTPSAVEVTLDGLTIANGRALSQSNQSSGAAVFNAGARVMARNCVFRNHVSLNHGAVYNHNSSDVQFVGCRFVENAGGGLYLRNCRASITDCEFTGHTQVAALRAHSSHTSISDCVFSFNVGHTGGAIYTLSGLTAVNRSSFESNTAGWLGGGAIFTSGDGSAITVMNSRFVVNMANGGGGAMYIGSRARITNSLFTGNSADEGGAIFAFALTDLINSTFTNNHAESVGGVIIGGSITNSILWDNTDLSGRGEDAQIGGSPVVRHSCIQGLTKFPGNGNIADHPVFAAQTTADYFALASASPCIDQGDNGAVPPGVLHDLIGVPRRLDIAAMPDCSQASKDCGPSPVVDMGAYEHAAGCSSNSPAAPVSFGPQDCNQNGISDNCEADCNETGLPDECDVATDASPDCNINNLPDECEPQDDCNANGIQDLCDIAAGDEDDCNGNNVPDACDLAAAQSSDCNANQQPDECELLGNCNANALQDICEIAAGRAPDLNGNAVVDHCELCFGVGDCGDLNGDEVRDSSCTWWSCTSGGGCSGVQTGFADVGGAFADCAPDGFVNLHDRVQVLRCFAGDGNCPFLNVDVGGPFGACVPDGFCNLHDVTHVLTTFAGTNPCTCPAVE